MKCVIFFILAVVPIMLSAQNNPEYAGLHQYDTVKVIDKSNHYKARLYIFTDLSSCEIANININNLYKMYGENTEYIVFLAGANSKDFELLNGKYFKGIRLVGDEFGIYKAYYKIKYQPLMLILDNSGVVYAWENVKNVRLNIDSTFKIIEKNNSTKEFYDLSKVLKRIKRIKIKKNGKPVITSLFHEAVYNKKQNNFIICNMRQPNLLLADSNGNIFKTIVNKQFFIVLSLSWFNKDSIVFLHGYSNNQPLGYYDAMNYTLYDSLFKDNLTHEEGPNPCVLLDKNKYVNSIRYFFDDDNKLFLKNDTNCFVLRDWQGNIIAAFDTVDNIYTKFRLSRSFGAVFGYSKNKIFSLQNYTNKLKIWNEDLHLLKTLKLDLGTKYRVIKSDLPNFDSKEHTAKFFNSVSQFWKLLIDPRNNNILLYFENETYPPGITDYMSDEVKHESIINIYSPNGKKLNKNEIILPKASIPFYFENNDIYTLQLNKNKLEIVIYKFLNNVK